MTTDIYSNSFDFKSNGGSRVYEYDGNGSLTNDPNKGFAFEYDLLGNPKSAISSYINNYTYSCSGDKLRVYSHFNGCIAKPPYFYWGWDEDDGGAIWDDDGSDIEDDDKSVYTASSNNSDIFQEWRDASNPRDTEYCGLFLFEHSILDKFLFDGGYCTFKDGEASFHYYLQDHLGNNRAVISEDGTVEQTTEYYPFGGIYGDVSTSPGLQPYKYNGKMFVHSLGLDLYNYGARMYDPALVVWNGVDPLAEKYCDISPYAYCVNNPVNAIDPDGKRVWVFATKLPSEKGGDIIRFATHTFVVVQTSKGKIHRFEYGPQGDPFFGISTLRQLYYDKSGNAVNNYMKGIQDDL